MAKYLLSYDEQDVKNGNLDVSPDGVLKSAGNGGAVLPQKVLFSDTIDGVTYCCGQKCSDMTIEEAYALCLKTMPFVVSRDGTVLITSCVLAPAGANGSEASLTGLMHYLYVDSCGSSPSIVKEVGTVAISGHFFKQS